MASIVYVGGVHSVGKSTILQRVKSRGLIDYEFVGFSLEMAKLAGTSSDNLNGLPYNQRVTLVNEVYNNIFFSGKDIIVDSHYSVLSEDPMPIRFEIGVPERHIKNFAGFVLFEARLETICKRRIKDNETATRKDKIAIELETGIERLFAQYITRLAGKRLYIIGASRCIERICEDFEEITRKIG